MYGDQWNDVQQIAFRSTKYRTFTSRFPRNDIPQLLPIVHSRIHFKFLPLNIIISLIQQLFNLLTRVLLGLREFVKNMIIFWRNKNVCFVKISGNEVT